MQASGSPGSERLAAVALAICALGAVGAAAPAPTPKGTAHTSTSASAPDPDAPDTSNTTVSGITVRASRGIPHVESTFPAQNAKVAPGLLVLRVTFTERMKVDGWAYVPSPKGLYPDCGETPRLLDDHKTFVLICRTLPSKTYAVWFNQPPVVDFSSNSGRSAIPYELSFTTADDEPIRTLADAMKADKALTNVSNPVEPLGSAPMGQPHITPE